MLLLLSSLHSFGAIRPTIATHTQFSHYHAATFLFAVKAIRYVRIHSAFQIKSLCFCYSARCWFPCDMNKVTFRILFLADIIFTCTVQCAQLIFLEFATYVIHQQRMRERRSERIKPTKKNRDSDALLFCVCVCVAFWILMFAGLVHHQQQSNKPQIMLFGLSNISFSI